MNFLPILMLSITVSRPCVGVEKPRGPLLSHRGCSLRSDPSEKVFAFLSVVAWGLWLSFSNVPSYCLRDAR